VKEFSNEQRDYDVMYMEAVAWHTGKKWQSWWFQRWKMKRRKCWCKTRENKNKTKPWVSYRLSRTPSISRMWVPQKANVIVTTTNTHPTLFPATWHNKTI